jgi:hypothetical protein
LDEEKDMTTSVHVLNLGPQAVVVNTVDFQGRVTKQQALYPNQPGIVLSVYDGQMFSVAEVDTRPSGAPLPDVPGGWVEVRPKGVHGTGKVRLWPANMPGEGPWSYAERVAQIKIDGKPLWHAGRYTTVGWTMDKHNLTGPEALDYLRYTDDWLSQEQIDQAARVAERDATAKWVSDPIKEVDPPSGEETPL